MLARHGFAVHWSRLVFLVLGSVLSLLNSALAPLQGAAMLVRRREPSDPVFILGHWRSGTTLLHELLALDPQFDFPSSYACFAPGHFLVTERVLGPVAQILSPRRDGSMRIETRTVRALEPQGLEMLQLDRAVAARLDADDRSFVYDFNVVRRVAGLSGGN
jgi:hypothetical protein